MRWVTVVIAVTLLTACANPVNQANRYTQMCIEAQADGRLGSAEEACHQALINVRIGRLGPDAQSQALYNLGQLKRRMKKFDEAEQLLRESLKVQDTISPADPAKIGSRLGELAAVYWQTSRFKEGWPLLERLMPISSVYTGEQRAYLKLLLHAYAAEYRKLGMTDEASQLEERAKGL